MLLPLRGRLRLRDERQGIEKRRDGWQGHRLPGCYAPREATGFPDTLDGRVDEMIETAKAHIRAMANELKSGHLKLAMFIHRSIQTNEGHGKASRACCAELP